MKIFKDDNLNEEYLEQGYVTLKLLNNDECSKIKNSGKKLLADKFYKRSDFACLPNPMSNENLSSNISVFFKELLDEKISEILSEDFNFFYSTFLVKKPKSTSLNWHADPSFYNQKKNECPINIWGGLTKLTKKNGCLKVIPKSHKLAFDYEPLPLSDLGTTAKCKSIKESYKELIEKHAIDVPLKKGEVIIHDQNLLHASHPNKSFFNKRVAYKLIYIPKAINKLEFAYFNKTNNNMDIYHLDRDEKAKNLSKYFKEENTNQNFKENQLIKSIILNSNKLPFTTLKEMEKIMNEPKNSTKAKFELK